MLDHEIRNLTTDIFPEGLTRCYNCISVSRAEKNTDVLKKTNGGWMAGPLDSLAEKPLDSKTIVYRVPRWLLKLKTLYIHSSSMNI